MRTNEQILARMAEDMRLRGLAQGTQEDYLMHSKLFLCYVNQPAEKLDEEDIRRYLSYLISEKKLKNSTVNTYNAALRFLFAVTLNRNLNYRQIPRLKQVRSIPEILTYEEVMRVFNSASSLRNKALLMTIYSAGLRVSEVCNLKIRDIDSHSMRIFIRCSKDNKDRYTLRHCFATHLLQAGTDVCRIKQLLGHTHIQSTTFYLHLLNFDSELKSPLDILHKKAVNDNG
jgi:site-specific recombinase XerD